MRLEESWRKDLLTTRKTMKDMEGSLCLSSYRKTGIIGKDKRKYGTILGGVDPKRNAKRGKREMLCL